MELSVLQKLEDVITSKVLGSFSQSKSLKFTIISNVAKMRNQVMLILAFLILTPLVSFSKPPAKKIKTVKTVKRSILEIEFGTFKYESPVIAKKSVFLG